MPRAMALDNIEVTEETAPGLLRDILLKLPEDARFRAIDDVNICLHCGKDLQASDGSVRTCYYMRDD